MAHRVTLIPGDGTGPELTEATRRVLEATGVDVRLGRPPGRRRRDGAGTGTPLPEETLASVQGEQGRAQGADHDADRHRLPLGQRRAAPRARPLRVPAPVQDLPGRAHALRQRRPRRSSARTPRTSTPGSSTRRAPTRPSTVIAELNGAAGEADRGRLRASRSSRSAAKARSGSSASRSSTRATHGRTRVSCVTKANIMKFTDGLFLDVFRAGRGRLPRDRAVGEPRRRGLHGARAAARGVRRARAAEPLRRHRQRPDRRPRRRPRRRAGRRTSGRTPPSSRRRTARRRSTRARTRSTRRR